MTTRKLLGRGATISLAALFLGCGDPEASPPNAAFEINIAGPSCQVTANSSVAPAQNPLVSQGMLENIMRSSAGDINCSVSDNGDTTFTFNGSFRATLDSGVEVELRVTNGAAMSPNGNDGTGTARLTMQRTSNPMYSLQSPADMPCTLTIRAVTAGGVWAEYSCTALQDSATPGATCTGNGAFVFNNCGT